MARPWWERYEADPNSGCWLWTGATSRGYGMARVDGKPQGVHRAMWGRENGFIPAGIEICHKCDTPPCMNPDHLFAGTKSDNQKDCVRKGRDRGRVKLGEANNRAVLTEDQVRAAYVDPRAQRVIADEMGVHRTTISLVQTGRKWGWLTKGLIPAPRRMGPWRPS